MACSNCQTEVPPILCKQWAPGVNHALFGRSLLVHFISACVLLCWSVVSSRWDCNPGSRGGGTCRTYLCTIDEACESWWNSFASLSVAVPVDGEKPPTADIDEDDDDVPGAFAGDKCSLCRITPEYCVVCRLRNEDDENLSSPWQDVMVTYAQQDRFISGSLVLFDLFVINTNVTLLVWFFRSCGKFRWTVKRRRSVDKPTQREDEREPHFRGTKGEMFGLSCESLISRDTYCIASFYFCILYCNQPACTAILQDLCSESFKRTRWRLKKILIQLREWDLCVLFTDLWRLKSYHYAHLRTEQLVADTLGVDGVLIWLQRKFILACRCSKWRSKTWTCVCLCWFNKLSMSGRSGRLLECSKWPVREAVHLWWLSAKAGAEQQRRSQQKLWVDLLPGHQWGVFSLQSTPFSCVVCVCSWECSKDRCQETTNCPASPGQVPPGPNLVLAVPHTHSSEFSHGTVGSTGADVALLSARILILVPPVSTWLVLWPAFSRWPTAWSFLISNFLVCARCKKNLKNSVEMCEVRNVFFFSGFLGCTPPPLMDIKTSGKSWNLYLQVTPGTKKTESLGSCWKLEFSDFQLSGLLWWLTHVHFTGRCCCTRRSTNGTREISGHKNGNISKTKPRRAIPRPDLERKGYFWCIFHLIAKKKKIFYEHTHRVRMVRVHLFVYNFYTRRSHGTGVCYATVIGFVAWLDAPSPPPGFGIFCLEGPPPWFWTKKIFGLEGHPPPPVLD